MTIFEAKKYLEENPESAVISPMDLVYTHSFMQRKTLFALEDVFGTWKIKREPRVIYVNEFEDGSLTGLVFGSKKDAIEDSAPIKAKQIKFIEVMDE